MNRGTYRAALFGIIVTALLGSVVGTGEAGVWGVKSHDPVSDAPSTLYYFSTPGAPLTVVGTVTLEGNSLDVDALAMDAAHTLYGFEVSSHEARSRLIVIDTTTAVATATGPYLTDRDIRGAVITSGDRFLALDAAANELLEIDPQTGQPVGSGISLSLDGQPYNLGNCSDLIEADGGGLILAYGNYFYALDSVTGALAQLYTDMVLAPDGSPVGIAGLAWEPDEGSAFHLVAYDVQTQDDIFGYDLDAGWARTMLYPDIIPSYNAGRGDLAAPPAMATGVMNDSPSGAGLPDIRMYPSPSAAQVRIAFTLPKGTPVRMAIYDMMGRCVRTASGDDLGNGDHEILWDGRDDNGRALPAGSYCCRVQAGSRSSSARVVLVR